MPHKAKQLLFVAAKYSGGFKLCRLLTANGLRILCYHGIWEGKNSHFSGTLFMSPAVFKQRMEHLKKLGYPVVSLQEGLQKLSTGNLPKGATVITIDDGWYSTYRYMLPIFEQLQLPATLYVTTYFALKQTPITQVALRYLLKESTETHLDVSDLEIEMHGRVELRDSQNRESIAAQINEAATRLDHDQRQKLCTAIGDRLNVDYQLLTKSRILDLMTTEELRDALKRGLDLQLHTHRHRISADGQSTLTKEVVENREVLEAITNSTLKHFCYPSGIYSQDYWPELEKLGVESATTCNPGINYAGTHQYDLNRVLDSEDKTNLEFEAELSGFSDVLRAVKSRMLSIVK